MEPSRDKNTSKEPQEAFTLGWLLLRVDMEFDSATTEMVEETLESIFKDAKENKNDLVEAEWLLTRLDQLNSIAGGQVREIIQQVLALRLVPEEQGILFMKFSNQAEK